MMTCSPTGTDHAGHSAPVRCSERKTSWPEEETLALNEISGFTSTAIDRKENAGTRDNRDAFCVLRVGVAGGSGSFVLCKSCNLARILRISMHGPSDLLSPLYDASRAQVTM